MDEAESLCNNIAIMINGRFVVYGGPGHLKQEYGKRQTITFQGKIGEHTEEKIMEYVASNLPYLDHFVDEKVPQSPEKGKEE